MPGSKLSELPALAVEPDDTDELYINDGGVSKRISWSVIKAAIASSDGEPALPTSIDGLVLWLDASDETTINAGSPANNDPVSAWADKSDSGFDASQATGDNRPLWKANIQNALGAIYFDPATSDPLLLELTTGKGLFRNLDACSILVVVKLEVDTYDSSGAVVCATQGDDSYARLEMASYVVRSEPVDASNDSGSSGYLEAPYERPGYARAFLAMIDFSDFGHAILRTSGVAANFITQTTSTLITPAATSDTDSGIVAIGNYRLVLDSHQWKGYVFEIAVFDRLLLESEQRGLLEGISTKWAIT